MTLRENHKTVMELVADELRKRLLAGDFKLGEKLDETQLANMLGVSRMPVRQALQKLASEGLVEMQSFIGATVVDFTPDDIQDIYDIRMSLEGLAARLAVQAITPEHFVLLDQALAEMRESIQANDYANFHLQNNAFHSILYEACGRKRLLRFVSDLRAQSALLMNTYLRLPDVGNLAVREHEMIIDACRRYDPEGAERLTKEHIGRSARALIDLVREQAKKE